MSQPGDSTPSSRPVAGAEHDAPLLMTASEAMALVKTSALRRMAQSLLVHGKTSIKAAHYLRADGVCPACATGTYFNAVADAIDALREADLVPMLRTLANDLERAQRASGVLIPTETHWIMRKAADALSALLGGDDA